MSAFDVIYDEALQALDNYAINCAKPRADFAGEAANFFSKMDDISDRARRMGVNIQAALDKALNNCGSVVGEAY